MKERDIRLDFIRSIAIIEVISVHFLLNSGFYETPLEGKTMLLMTILRTAFLSCVPLFIMLSGYLVHHKQISKKYYSSIWSTINIYLIVSIACIVFKLLYLKQPITLAETFVSILGFTADPYAWYINMYIGLFLLIPFLNIIYNNLASQKNKQLLIFTCIALTAIPSLNIKYVIFPNWWGGFYPITYYFIGAYFSEYEIKIRKSINVFLIILSVLTFGFFNFYLGYKANFVEQLYTSYGGFECIIVTTLIFLLGLNTNLRSVPKTVYLVITKLSKLSLGMYLSSWIIDVIVYGKLNSSIVNIYHRFHYAPIVILSVIIGSAVLSYCFSCINTFVCKTVRYMKYGYLKTKGIE